MKSSLDESISKTHEICVFEQLLTTLPDGSSNIYVSKLLERAARLFSDRVAVHGATQVFSYGELYTIVSRCAARLRDMGVRTRDRVFLLSENSVEFYICYYAIWHAGAVCVPLNTFLHERELRYIYEDAAPALILVSTALFDGAAHACDPERIVRMSEFIATAPLAGMQPLELTSDELCLLLYTSGTTGTAKGVMLSSRNIVMNALQAASRLGSQDSAKGLSAQDRFFAALPLFHVFAQNACIWLPCIIGGMVIVVPKIDRRDIMQGLGQRPTIFFGVPALYGLLCMMKTAPLDSVRFFVSGGDALPNRIRSAFAMIYGRKICSGYGLTEASPVVAVHIENQEVAGNVVGRPLIGISAQIRDASGEVCEVGTTGLLWIRGDNIMLGYYNAPALSSEVIEDGWLNTGDLARFDANGLLAIVGRSKELIIHKGFNIYPQEVENVLMSHPAVFKAAVLGHDDELSGQVPVAYVALRERPCGIERVLREHCSGRLASYKIPRNFICVDDLPMNATGKIDKKRLRQLDT